MIQLIHADILTPHLPTLALLAIEQPEVFADYLTDDSVQGWLDVPLAEQKLDMLLLFARDEKGCPPVEGQYAFMLAPEARQKGYGKITAPDRLFPGHFTPAALGAWLRRVEDERAEQVADLHILNDFGTGGGNYDERPWLIASKSYQPMIGVLTHDTEAAAWLNLKCRVLEMFGELERSITIRTRHIGRPADEVLAEMREAGIDVIRGIQDSPSRPPYISQLDPLDQAQAIYSQVSRAIDFLPPQSSQDRSALSDSWL